LVRDQEGGGQVTIAVVIPSRLQPNPATGKPYLHEAVASVRKQVGFDLRYVQQADIQLIIALDPEQHVGEENRAFWGATVINAPAANQAAAVNTGMNAAVESGASIIGHLECDDLWNPWHLQAALWALDTFSADFVSSSSELFSDLPAVPQGHVATSGAFHFPIASSWVIRAAVWKEVGPYSAEYRVHPDNFWLGKLNALRKFRRVHLVENTGVCTTSHPWLETLRRVSWVVPMPMMFGAGKMSVRRRVQEGSVLARNSTERSDEEYGRLARKYGDLAMTW
jgi:hypothetical protein